MDQNNLLLQLAYSAVQSAQNTLIQQNHSTQKHESGKDFQTLLDEKRTEVENQQPQQPTEDQEKQDALPAEVMAQGAALTQTAMVPAMVLVPEAGTQEGVAAVMPETGIVPDVTANVEPVVSVGPEVVSETAMPEQAVQQPEMEQAPVISQQPETTQGETTTADVAEEPVVTVSSTQENTSTQADQDSGTQDRPMTEQKQDTKTRDYEVLDAQTSSADRPVFQKSESLPQRVGDAPVLDTESGDLEGKLTSMMTASLEDGGQRLEIKLAPEHLGNVVVEMSRTPEGVLHIVLHTENEQAAKILSEHSNMLGMMLQNGQQGEVRIEVQHPNQNEQPWQQPDQNGNQNGQDGRQQQEQRRQHSDPERFLQELRLGLISTAAQ